MDDINLKAEKPDQALIEKVQSIVDGGALPRDEKLQQIAGLLEKKVPVFDWVGFYLVDPEADRELILGPYVGEPTEHTRIPFGTGICGQAADTHQTFVVQDVSQATNYLACNINVKAEIVLPIMKNDTFMAELDIDSHTKNGITKKHKAMLQQICNIITAIF